MGRRMKLRSNTLELSRNWTRTRGLEWSTLTLNLAGPHGHPDIITVTWEWFMSGYLGVVTLWGLCESHLPDHFTCTWGQQCHLSHLLMPQLWDGLAPGIMSMFIVVSHPPWSRSWILDTLSSSSQYYATACAVVGLFWVEPPSCPSHYGPCVPSMLNHINTICRMCVIQ